MLCSTGDDPEREKEYMKILRSNIVDGVIMGVNNQKPEAYAEFGKPLVMLDYYVNDEVPVVVSDHEMGGRLAAEELLRSGCRYVLHIGSETDTDRVLSYKSHRALRETLETNGIQTREVDIKWNSFDFQNYFEMACLILEENPEIDGIMAADMPASAFLKAAQHIRCGFHEILIYHVGHAFNGVTVEAVFFELIESQALKFIGVPRNLIAVPIRLEFFKDIFSKGTLFGFDG